MESTSPQPHPFSAGDFERKKLRKEKIARGAMLTASLMLIVPVLLIIGYLFTKHLQFSLSTTSGAIPVRWASPAASGCP